MDTVIIIFLILAFLQSQAAIIFATLAYRNSQTSAAPEVWPEVSEEEDKERDELIAAVRKLETARETTPDSWDDHRRAFERLTG